MYRALLLITTFFALFLWIEYAQGQTFADPPFARLGRGPINQALYSPDGKVLATPSSDGIWLYDPESLEQVGFLDGHQGLVWSVAFSADGRLLVSGGEDGTVRLWDVAERRELVVWEGHKGQVFCVAFSPDGRLCASGSIHSNSNEVRLWDVESRQGLGPLSIGPISQFRFWVFAVAFSPDGQRLAAATGTGIGRELVYIWDVGTRKEFKTLFGHKREVTGVAFSPDGRYLATVSFDRTFRLWDATTYQELDVTQGDASQAVLFSPDSRYLATFPPVNIYDVQLRRKMTRLDIGPESTFKSSVSFSPRGGDLALAVGANIYSLTTEGSWLRILDWGAPLQQRERVLEGDASPVSLALSPDARFLAIGSRDGKVRLWDVARLEKVTIFSGHSYGVQALALSPDGTLLASGGGDEVVHLWDIVQGQELPTLGRVARVGYLEFSPGGKHLISVGDEVVRLWDIARREQVSRWPGKVATFSPDGRLLAFSGGSSLFNQIVLWDLTAQQETARLRKHQQEVHWLGFSPDSRFLSSVGGGEEVWLWEVGKGEPAIPQPYRGDVAAFSPDGKFLAVGQHTGAVHLWEVAEKQEASVLESGTTPVTWLRFSADGKRLLVRNKGAPVRVWNVESQRFVKALGDWVDLAAFSANGRTLATVSPSGPVQLWGARPSPIESVVEAEVVQLPQRTALLPAYPNPFNAGTVIRYELAVPARVHLAVYDLLGQKVRTLVQGFQEGGSYKLLWDGRDQEGQSLASGVYFYRLETAGWAQTRKMLILR